MGSSGGASRIGGAKGFRCFIRLDSSHWSSRLGNRRKPNTRQRWSQCHGESFSLTKNVKGLRNRLSLLWKLTMMAGNCSKFYFLCKAAKPFVFYLGRSFSSRPSRSFSQIHVSSLFVSLSRGARVLRSTRCGSPWCRSDHGASRCALLVSTFFLPRARPRCSRFLPYVFHGWSASEVSRCM